MNKMATMTANEKQRLNEAIVDVITHQFKKDCPEAHSLVTSWGLKIFKYDGRFEVINSETSKSVQVSHSLYYIDLSHSSRKLIKLNRVSKIDYVSFLTTPVNRDKYEDEVVHSKYRTARHDLREAKWNVKYNQEALDDAQKEFDKKLAELKKHYEWNIKYHSERLVTEKRRVADIRKEFNLK